MLIRLADILIDHIGWQGLHVDRDRADPDWCDLICADPVTNERSTVRGTGNLCGYVAGTVGIELEDRRTERPSRSTRAG